MNQSRSLVSVIGFIFSVGLLAGLVWGNINFANKKVSGEGFLIQWLGIHSLVKDGNSPYSDLVTNQIREKVKYQSSFAEGGLPRYTSPLFSGIVILPFALIEDNLIAQAVWRTAQLMALFGILLIGIRITTWKPIWYLFLLFSLITLLSFHVLVPWLDGSLAIWVSLFLGVAFLSIRNNWNEIGGIFLALAAIQPQMTILIIIFILLWAASQRRRMLVFWFFITLILISILGLFLVPDWIMQYLRLIYNYSKNFPPGSPGALFIESWPGLGKQLGLFFTIGLGILLLAEAWLALKRDFRHFFWAACLVLVISQWIGIPVVPGNFTSLILPLILVSAMLTERWPVGGQWVAVILSLVLFIWEWALFYLDLMSPRPEMQLNLIIPMPLLLLIGLYWVRWWAIKPRRLLIEELKSGEIF